ncbi:NAD(P)-dependent oxidoreductase [Nocardiopsis tropica]|uniref:NAD(P)-dependent oxidoreductase n=1 Tax=Nocardiopsis tropica TaxID=109330 RepID=UPI002E882541|nr:NAD(P)-dependent oxidoreductase [Nocardiopsis tropica]
MLTIATDQRGRTALQAHSGVTAVPLGAPAAARADILWRRAGTTAADVTDTLTRARGLRWVHTDTAGVDDLPLADLAARDITLTKTSAYTDAVAEWIVTAVLIAAKGTPAYAEASRAGRWEPGVGAPRLISGTRALIVGNGAIGQTAGGALAAMEVHVSTVGSRAAAGWEALLPGTDWLVLACPLTERTHHLIGAAVLGALPAGAWLINAARGQVVDEHALAAALDARRLGGAVLDTFAVEPLPADSPLWKRPTVVITPHDAWRASGAGRRQAVDFLDQLHRYRSGQPLHRVVDAVAEY